MTPEEFSSRLSMILADIELEVMETNDGDTKERLTYTLEATDNLLTWYNNQNGISEYE